MTAATLIGEGILGFALFSLVLAFGLVLIRHHEAEQDWRDERRELISRIQRPEYIPPAAGSAVWNRAEDKEPDQIDLINTIADPATSVDSVVSD